MEFTNNFIAMVVVFIFGSVQVYSGSINPDGIDLPGYPAHEILAPENPLWTSWFLDGVNITGEPKPIESTPNSKYIDFNV